MKNPLSNGTKNRLIEELQKILYEHPRYREDSGNVQNKFSFETRPQRGIIVNGASADRVRLSADNYVGRLSSFVMQVPVENCRGKSLEWVIENRALLEKYSPRRDVFPSPPGVYFLEVTRMPDVARGVPGQFVLDPVLNVSDEPLITFTSGNVQTGQISREDIYPGSVRLWLDGRRPLLYGNDFTVDFATGEVTFHRATPVGSTVFADYRYRVSRQGPFDFLPEQASFNAIPGAVLAFGDRAELGDKIAVVVGHGRSEVAEVYGGKFEVNLDLLVFSRDPDDREKLSDYVVTSLLERQSTLGYDGFELIDVSPGAEAEEVYDSVLDDYYYDGNVQVGIRVDWEVHLPLPVEIFRSELNSRAAEAGRGYLDGTVPTDLLRAEALRGDLDGIPTFLGRNNVGYERVR